MIKKVDYSNGTDNILVITHNTKSITDKVIFRATDEDTISEWIASNIGEQINDINGCPIFMEVSSWASLNAGENGLKYSLANYPDIDASKWVIELCNR